MSSLSCTTATHLRRLALLGYRPYLAGGTRDEDARRGERNRTLLRIGLASLGAMQAMMFGEALYLDTAHSMGPATRDFLRWITFLVSTPVVFYAGWPFLDDARPMERVYFPAIAEGANDFAEAVRAALDAFAEQISDYLSQRSRGDDHAA